MLEINEESGKSQKIYLKNIKDHLEGSYCEIFDNGDIYYYQVNKQKEGDPFVEKFKLVSKGIIIS